MCAHQMGIIDEMPICSRIKLTHCFHIVQQSKLLLFWQCQYFWWVIESFTFRPAFWTRWCNVGLILAHLLRRSTNTTWTSVRCFVFCEHLLCRVKPKKHGSGYLTSKQILHVGIADYYSEIYYSNMPSKDDTLNQCCLNVGLASPTNNNPCPVELLQLYFSSF